MTETRLKRASDLFSSRLRTLRALLDKAELELGLRSGGLEDVMSARLAPDMFSFPYQVVFACNQPNGFCAWVADEAPQAVDPAALSFEELKAHVDATSERVSGCADKFDDSLLEKEKRVDVQDGAFLRLSGAAYLDDFLTPNFYFHLVTAYALLRMKGVDIGKADYMLHVLHLVEPSVA